MSKIFFHSDYTVLSRTELMQSRTEMEIRDEPMLFRSDPDFALDKGGPITREFLSKLPCLKPLNEIRNHVQVYLDDPKAGW